jgi:hypothetical protein
MINKRLIGKDLEGSGSGLIAVLSKLRLKTTLFSNCRKPRLEILQP